MIRKLPLIPTIIVALAVLVMIGLGIWQLGRAHQKDAAVETWRANISKPATAYPADGTDEHYMFRRVSANCLRVIGWQVVGGRNRQGQPGWRHIANCATGAEGPGLVVDMGVSMAPNAKVRWTGGFVRGHATHEPDERPFLARVTGRASPLRLMIVSETAAPGLVPSAPPDPESVPNNHRSYMVQWFFFAAIAAVIYVLAVRKRLKDEAPPPA
jgi:cytochrome oxidase assembly protein ShyY1